MTLALLLHTSPDKAVLLAVAGVLLMYVELNRPGTVLFGAVGILLFLLSLAALLRYAWHPIGVLLVLIAATVQLLGLRRSLPWEGPWIAGLGFFFGLRSLVADPRGVKVHIPAAFLAGIILGPGTSGLTAIARRARMNKGLDL